MTMLIFASDPFRVNVINMSIAAVLCSVLTGCGSYINHAIRDARSAAPGELVRAARSVSEDFVSSGGEIGKSVPGRMWRGTPLGTIAHIDRLILCRAGVMLEVEAFRGQGEVYVQGIYIARDSDATFESTIKLWEFVPGVYMSAEAKGIHYAFGRRQDIVDLIPSARGTAESD